jgi:hypothetical protein
MNLYWIGGDGNWEDSAHWDTASGGPGGHAAPTSADNAIFDLNSSANVSFTATVNNGTDACKDLDSSAFVPSPPAGTVIGFSISFNTDNCYLNVYGNVTLSRYTGFNYNGSEIWNCGLKIKGACTLAGLVDPTQNYGGGFFPGRYNVYVDSGGSLSLASDLVAYGLFDTAGGVINSNGYGIFVNTFKVTSAVAHNFNNSFITCYQYYTSAHAQSFELTSSASATGSTLTMSPSTNSFISCGTIWDVIVLGGGGLLKINNSIATPTFHDLIFESDASAEFKHGVTYTVTGRLSSTLGSSSFTSDVNGSSYIINAAATSLEFVGIKDCHAGGAASWAVGDGVNNGGNTGITFGSSDPTGTRYWVGDGGFFDNSSHWANTSGGTPGASAPRTGMNVVFDANSFTTTGQIVRKGLERSHTGSEFLNLTCTGVLHNPTLALDSTFTPTNGAGFTIAGNFILDPNMSLAKLGPDTVGVDFQLTINIHSNTIIDSHLVEIPWYVIINNYDSVSDPASDYVVSFLHNTTITVGLETQNYTDFSLTDPHNLTLDVRNITLTAGWFGFSNYSSVGNTNFVATGGTFISTGYLSENPGYNRKIYGFVINCNGTYVSDGTDKVIIANEGNNGDNFNDSDFRIGTQTIGTLKFTGVSTALLPYIIGDTNSGDFLIAGTVKVLRLLAGMFLQYSEAVYLNVGRVVATGTLGNDISIADNGSGDTLTLNKITAGAVAGKYLTLKNTVTTAVNGYTIDASELVTNGHFTGSAAGWTLEDGAAYGTDNIEVTDFGDIIQDVGLIAGQVYRLTFDCVGYGLDGLQVQISSISKNFGEGSNTWDFVAPSDTDGTIKLVAYLTGTIDNVSVHHKTAVESGGHFFACFSEDQGGNTGWIWGCAAPEFMFEGEPFSTAVYTLGRYSQNYPLVLDLTYPISARDGDDFSLDNIEIGSILVVGNDFFVSWKRNDFGVITYGVDKIDHTAKLNGAYFETRMISGNREMFENFQKFVFAYTELPTSTDFSLEYSKDFGETWTEMQLKRDEIRSILYADSEGIEATVIQLRGTFQTNVNDTPAIERGEVILRG